MALPILFGVVFNAAFLASFCAPGLRGAVVRRLPHWPLLALSVRDLLVALVLVPTTIDWMIANIGSWTMGSFWCSTSGLLDFTLATAYPLILIIFGVTLYTRAVIPIDPVEAAGLPMEQADPMDRVINSNQNSR